MPKLVTWMNNQRVGELTKLANGAHTFKYAPEWLASRYARPLSLSLPLQRGNITSDAVFNFFDNLLPDSPIVRDRIVKRYHAKSRQPFDLLSEIGRDSVGAVTLLPENETITRPIMAWEKLTEARLEEVLTAYKADIPLGMIREENDFRISVAGAQEKTALLRIGNDWCIPKGITPTTHIIKLPIGEIRQPNATLDLSQSVDNEYYCLLLAKELGLNVPDAEIIKAGRVRALAVERFDRRWNTERTVLLRLPQEDMCQTFGLPSSVKYESDGGPGIARIMAFLMGSSEALRDRYDFMKFQVFQWLIGATDGHAKNFSVFIQAGGSYRLTPFYDIISAFPVLGGTGIHISDLKLAMGLNASKGKKTAIDKIYPRHFLATAKVLNDFRISVAGAQEKTALLRIGNDWCIPKGITPTTHIIKLPIGEIRQPNATLDLSQSVDNEYYCLLLAKELGLNVPDAEIIKAGRVRALAVERFDRRWNTERTVLLRLPQEDMCQTFGLPSSVKYESDGGPGIARIMAFLMGSSEALRDRYDFMKFQVFQWLIGATDGHAKNFSVFIQAGGSYRLTPFYDIISAFPVLGGTGIHISDLKLAMGLNASKGKKTAIDKIYPRHFLATAKVLRFPEVQMHEILSDFARMIPAALDNVKTSLPTDFPENVVTAVETNVLRLHGRLSREYGSK